MAQEEKIAALEARVAALDREVDQLSERLDLTRVALAIVLGMILDPTRPAPAPRDPLKVEVFQ